MSRIAGFVCVLGLALVAAPLSADDNKPAKPAAAKADPTEKALDALSQTVALKDGTIVNETSLAELLFALGKQHAANFVMNDQSFKSVYGDAFVIGERKPRLQATGFTGMTVHQFLAAALEDMGATYLVRNGAIEIVPVEYAAKATKSGISQTDDGHGRLNEPLVSVAFKEKPLNEAVAKIAEMYDLTVVVGPQAADAKAGFVTARLLNVPADKALEMLALQCDLRVLRHGTAYYLTSRDHASELFAEKLDKERQKIEVEKMREAPAKPPAPPTPEKPPAP